MSDFELKDKQVTEYAEGSYELFLQFIKSASGKPSIVAIDGAVIIIIFILKNYLKDFPDKEKNRKRDEAINSIMDRIKSIAHDLDAFNAEHEFL